MRLLPLALAMFLTVSAFGATKAPVWAERKTRTEVGVTIEYSAGDEAYADELVRRLPDLKVPAPVVETGLTLDMLAEQRTRYLGRIAHQLALAEPSKEMNAVFTGVAGLMQDFAKADSGLPRRYALWRRPELIERLSAGEKIPGFSMNAKGEVQYQVAFQASREESQSATVNDHAAEAAIARIWDKMPMAFSVGNTSPADDITKGLERTVSVVQGLHLIGQVEQFKAFVLLHEATESGVTEHYIVSKDRRWFCDGIANYVAWKTIEAERGPEEAKKAYDLDAQLKKFVTEAPWVNLEKWPAVENMTKPGAYSEDLNTANYAFATKVIADICAKHGDDFLPKLFAEIGQTPRDKTTIKTVYRAFKKLTGEDMRDYLPKPGRKG